MLTLKIKKIFKKRGSGLSVINLNLKDKLSLKVNCYWSCECFNRKMLTFRNMKMGIFC